MYMRAGVSVCACVHCTVLHGTHRPFLPFPQELLCHLIARIVYCLKNITVTVCHQCHFQPQNICLLYSLFMYCQPKTTYMSDICECDLGSQF